MSRTGQELTFWESGRGLKGTVPCIWRTMRGAVASRVMLGDIPGMEIHYYVFIFNPVVPRVQR